MPTETEHKHDENCQHDHEDKHEETEDVNLNTSHKKKKEEKRFIKAMKKQGLRPVDNIARVTLRTNKNFIMYIDNPVIMTSGNGENNFVIFGEPKYLDFEKSMATKEAEKLNQEENDKPEEKLGDIKNDQEDEDDEAEVEQGDIPDESIDNLMSYSNCSRNKAIRTLKKTNGDLVEAITMLT